MNRDVFEGRWAQIRGRVREQWGRLTDDDVDTVGGKADQLIGKIQERYGVAKDDAERQFDRWLENVDRRETVE